VLQALLQPEGPVRVGFTATKKIGNAVVRNRAKRRLRAAARLALADASLATAPPQGWDLVLIARDGTGTRPWDKLLSDLRGALRQTGVLPEREPIRGADSGT
jgi:ribonuclease P protein component